MEAYGIPGALVGVWAPGLGRMVLAEGIADVECHMPMRRSHHVRIGSITKSFTVTVMLQLAEEGKLSLDDPVVLYIPDMQNDNATLGELADMTSGIFNYTEDGDLVNDLLSDLERTWMESELVDVARRNLPYFPPGEGWHYSNTATVMLGMVIEQVTGRFVGDEIKDRIIDPLGLEGTFYPQTPIMPEPYARGYAFEPLQDLTITAPSAAAGSGAMISRLGDLRKWGVALGNGLLVSRTMHSQRMDSLAPITFDPCDDDVPGRRVVSCPEYDRYGMGIGEISSWLGHTGEYIGYTSLVMFEPQSNSVVVILMNRFGVGAHVPTAVFREFARELNPMLGIPVPDQLVQFE